MIINWSDVDKMIPNEIENLRVSLIKEIQTIKAGRALAIDEQNEIKKQILLLESQKHELRTAIQKANYSIGLRQADIEILTTKFWAKRNQC
jgi:hypothetical protein